METCLTFPKCVSGSAHLFFKCYHLYQNKRFVLSDPSVGSKIMESSSSVGENFMEKLSSL